MTNLVRATAFLRASDWSILKLDVYDKGKQSQYESDLEILIKQIQSSNPRAEERNKLQTANGSWAYKLDDNKICYMILTSNEYPERQAFAMIKEMENGLKKLPEYYNITPKEVAKFIKNFIKDLQDKYNNLQGIDKIQQAQAQVDEVRLVMEDNVKRMLDNNKDIDSLDQKAGDMKLKSKQFAQQSTDLARIMYWRNVKLKVAIVIIVLSVLLYIAVPLIIQATAVTHNVSNDLGITSSSSSSASATTTSMSTNTTNHTNNNVLIRF